MHPFHMLGNQNASPPVSYFHLGTLISFSNFFWLPENLLADKGRLKTCLNGGSSLGSSKIQSIFELSSNFFTFSRDLALNQSTLTNLSFDNSNFEVSDNNANLNENTKKTTNYPVPNRMSPRQLPGVYMILCLANNKRYYGESTNVSSRLSQHKSRLRRNIHEIPELQHDWNLYGESSFEFSALFLSRDCDKAQREALELESIARYHNICYNKFTKSSRKKENNPFWKQTHSDETRKQISLSLAEHYKTRMPEGLAINLKGKIYPSISEASRETNHSRDTIRRWLKDPNNLDCFQIDTSRPQENDQFSLGYPLSNQEKNIGLPKPISLDGKVYPSIAEASRNLGCSRSNIQRRLRTDKENCFFLPGPCKI